MPLTELVGAGAAVLTTISFLPQAILVVRTGDTRSISLTMYILFTIGVALWCIYGVLLGSWPMMLANAFTLAFATLILSIKVRNTLHGDG